MPEAQAAPNPGLFRVGQRVGRLLSAAADTATESLLLLGLPAAAPLSAAASLSTAGSWADRGITICREPK
jgi:hypothetical protein